MSEKETQTRTKEYSGIPSPTEVAKELERIEQATEVKEKKEGRGETLEEEFDKKQKEWQDKNPVSEDVIGVLEHEEKEGGQEAQETRELIRGNLEFWMSENENYILKNFDPRIIKINNSLGFDVPIKFFDYLVGEAREILNKQDFPLGEVMEIDAKIDFKEPAIKLRVKDKSKRHQNEQIVTSIFSYGIGFKFSIRSIDSPHGMFNLKI